MGNIKSSNLKKTFSIFMLLSLAFLLVGCGGSDISMSSELDRTKIKNSDITELIIFLENIGSKSISGNIIVEPKNDEVKILETEEIITLDSREITNKRIKLQGFSNSLRNDYLINIKFISENEIIGLNQVVLTVEGD